MCDEIKAGVLCESHGRTHGVGRQDRLPVRQTTILEGAGELRQVGHLKYHSVLTHWPLRNLNEILEMECSKDFSDWWLRHLLWNYPNLNVTGLHWWSVNIGSGNSLVPSGNLSQCWPISLLPYGVTRPEWVNSLSSGKCGFDFKCVIFKDIVENCSQNYQCCCLWYRTLLMIVSGNSLVPSSNKPLPEPVVIKVHDAIWCH